MSNNYFIASDGELYHWKAKNHKYIDRKMVKGKWQYTYPDDNKAKTPTVSKEYQAEVAYNSQKNVYPSGSTTTKQSTTKVNTGKNALGTSKKASSEYEAELAYNSQKNKYPSGSEVKSKITNNTEKKTSILDKGEKWFNSVLKNVINGVDKITGAAAKDAATKAKRDENDFEHKTLSYLRNTAVKLDKEYRNLVDKISDRTKQVEADRKTYAEKQAIADEKEAIRQQLHDKLFPTSSSKTGLQIPNKALTQSEWNKLDRDYGKAEAEASKARDEAYEAKQKLDASEASYKDLEQRRKELEKSIEDIYSSYYNALDTRDKLREKTRIAEEEYSETLLGKLEALPDKISDFASDVAFETEYAYDRAKDWVSDRISDLEDNTIGKAKDWLGYDESGDLYRAEERMRRAEYALNDSLYNIADDQERISEDPNQKGPRYEDAVQDLSGSMWWTEKNYIDYYRSQQAYESAKAQYEETPLAKIERWIDGFGKNDSDERKEETRSHASESISTKQLEDRSKLVGMIAREAAAKDSMEEAQRKYESARLAYEATIKEARDSGVPNIDMGGNTEIEKKSRAMRAKITEAESDLVNAKQALEISKEAYGEAAGTLNNSSNSYDRVYGDYEDFLKEVRDYLDDR